MSRASFSMMYQIVSRKIQGSLLTKLAESTNEEPSVQGFCFIGTLNRSLQSLDRTLLGELISKDNASDNNEQTCNYIGNLGIISGKATIKIFPPCYDSIIILFSGIRLK